MVAPEVQNPGDQDEWEAHIWLLYSITIVLCNLLFSLKNKY